TLPAGEKINVSGAGVGGNGAIRSEAGSDNKIAGPIELLANSSVRILNGGSGGGKLTLQGSVDLNGFELEGEGASATHVLQIDGQITGSGGTIDKDDDFMMILTNGANDYSGNTTIDSGVLRITDKDALGDANGITDINADGTLQFHNLAGGVFDAAEEIQYEGDGAGGIGALDNSGGNTTLSASASLTMIGDASIGNSAAGTTFTIEPDVNIGVNTLALAGVGQVDVTGKITDFFGGSGFVPGFYEVDGLIVGEAENYTSRSSGPSGPISNKLTLNFEASEDPDGGADGTWESTTARQSHNWTLGGNVTYNASPATQLPGIAASYVFPTRGSNNAANKATAQQLESLPGNPSNGDATFEIWFKPNNLTGGNQVLWESGGGGDGTSFTIRNGNTLRFTAKDGGSNLVIETTLTPEMASDFIQAVAAYDRNNPNPQDTLRLYINGVEVAGSPVTNNNVNDWAGGDKSGLGGRNGAAGGTGAGVNLNFGTFAGEIAIVRFYERRMSATDVKKNFDLVAGCTFTCDAWLEVGPGYSDKVLALSNLEAYWEFKDGAGSTTVADSSPNGRSGNIVSAGLSPGIIGDALTLDGDGDYVQLNASAYKGVTGTAARTMVAWIKKNTTGANVNDGGIMSWGTNSSSQKWVWRLVGGSGDRLRVETANGGVESSPVGGKNLNDGQWHQVASVFDPTIAGANHGSIQFYIDGVLQGIQNNSGAAVNTASNANVRIGTDRVTANNNTRDFNGQID
ncbi:MAG: LamG-like jellyroll fold domain-containing protein, partial [Pirellulales bacterium]